MDYASMFFGVAIFFVALGLESHRRLTCPHQPDSTPLDAEYAMKRQRGRGWTNLLMCLIAFLAFLAGLVGTGPVWISLWAAIPLMLVVTVVMASIDAFRTDRYLRAKLPEIERQTLATIAHAHAEGSAQSASLRQSNTDVG